jgi:hypothetical protein
LFSVVAMGEVIADTLTLGFGCGAGVAAGPPGLGAHAVLAV